MNLEAMFLEIDKKTPLETLSQVGDDLAGWQRGINWWIGDLARYAEARFPDTWQQAFPEWMSPGLIARCKAVAAAYPQNEDRNLHATWTQHMQVANDPERVAKVAAIVDKGQTSDESRRERQEAATDRPRWLLAVDVHYHLHRHWFSGAGVEAATRVSDWVCRTVERLKEKGLTDVVCCFEGKANFRKDLTQAWEDKYKDRPPKDGELIGQLNLVRELLENHNFRCVSQDGFEADDVMASYAKQFSGKTTLLSQDKDVRQCLSDKANILLDVEWKEDPSSADLLPNYKWLTAKQHFEATGIRPDQWADYQTIAGDTTDGVKGAVGIGEKGAADLIKTFGTVEAAIEAAKAEDERIKPKKRESLLELADRLDIMRQLVTLQTDLRVPMDTRIA